MNHPRKDEITNRYTTGHVWDGIEELNTPLPRWWVYFFLINIVIALVLSIFYPSWPLGTSYYAGITQSSLRSDLYQELIENKKVFYPLEQKILSQPIQQTFDDPELFDYAYARGESLFKENCTTCHQTGGVGTYGYPNLTDDDWIWGGQIEEIYTTIAQGVRNQNPQSRNLEMPSFGKDALLKASEMSAVADFVLELSRNTATEDHPGYPIYKEQCVSCHGAKNPVDTMTFAQKMGGGGSELGAPRFDNIWLRGSDKSAILKQIHNPELGIMGSFKARLSEAELRQLTIYVYSLGSKEFLKK